jgi:hypothetical protein
MFDKHDLRRMPAVIVDDFFDDPDSVREMALSMDMEKAVQGHFPGFRTKNLLEIIPDFHNLVIKKWLSNFYSLDRERINLQAKSHFHLIPAPNKEDKDDMLNQSWIHTDKQCVAAGLIYLTPNANKDSGTSLFDLKDGIKVESLDTSPRLLFHTLGITDALVHNENYEETLKKHNDCFEETVNVKNKYNRLIAYDGSRWHAANNYWTGTEDRLTLVFFIYEMETDSGLPLQRIDSMEKING